MRSSEVSSARDCTRNLCFCGPPLLQIPRRAFRLYPLEHARLAWRSFVVLALY